VLLLLTLKGLETQPNKTQGLKENTPSRKEGQKSWTRQILKVGMYLLQQLKTGSEMRRILTAPSCLPTDYHPVTREQ
jgi:hypothetical protein